MQANYTDVLLSCRLLRFCETSGSAYIPKYLSKQTIRQPVTFGSRVPEWPVFSTLRIFLTQVDDTVFEIIFERSLKGGGSSRNGGIVSGEDIHLVVIFEEEGPIL